MFRIVLVSFRLIKAIRNIILRHISCACGRFIQSAYSVSGFRKLHNLTLQSALFISPTSAPHGTRNSVSVTPQVTLCQSLPMPLSNAFQWLLFLLATSLLNNKNSIFLKFCFFELFKPIVKSSLFRT